MFFLFSCYCLKTPTTGLEACDISGLSCGRRPPMQHLCAILPSAGSWRSQHAHPGRQLASLSHGPWAVTSYLFPEPQGPVTGRCKNHITHVHFLAPLPWSMWCGLWGRVDPVPLP